MRDYATIKDLENLIKDSQLENIQKSEIGHTGYLDIFEDDLKPGWGLDEAGRTFITFGPVSVSDKYKKQNDRYFRIFQRYTDNDSILVTTGNDGTGDGPCSGAVDMETFQKISEMILNGKTLTQSDMYITPETWEVGNRHQCPTCNFEAGIIFVKEAYCSECR